MFNALIVQLTRDFAKQKGAFILSLSSQILFDQAQRSIKTQLQTFVKE